MADFLTRFAVLEYDHLWHTYPYVFGLFFFAVSIASWSLYILFRPEHRCLYLERIAFSAAVALFVHYKDRRRVGRDRRV